MFIVEFRQKQLKQNYEPFALVHNLRMQDVLQLPESAQQILCWLKISVNQHRRTQIGSPIGKLANRSLSRFTLASFVGEVENALLDIIPLNASSRRIR